MSRVVGKRCAAAAVLACACAGLGSYSRVVEETRAGLIGLEARDLRACLGVPSDFVIDGDVEQQTFRFAHEDEFEIHDRTGGLGGVVLGDRSPAHRGWETGAFPDSARDPSYCQLDFELTRGRVTRVAARGRTREGMNADGSCLLRAEPCLAYADGDAPASDE